LRGETTDIFEKAVIESAPEVKGPLAALKGCCGLPFVDMPPDFQPRFKDQIPEGHCGAGPALAAVDRAAKGYSGR
jgi:hypothetical protein